MSRHFANLPASLKAIKRQPMNDFIFCLWPAQHLSYTVGFAWDFIFIKNNIKSLRSSFLAFIQFASNMPIFPQSLILILLFGFCQLAFLYLNFYWIFIFSRDFYFKLTEAISLQNIFNIIIYWNSKAVFSSSSAGAASKTSDNINCCHSNGLVTD